VRGNGHGRLTDSFTFGRTSQLKRRPQSPLNAMACPSATWRGSGRWDRKPADSRAFAARQPLGVPLSRPQDGGTRGLSGVRCTDYTAYSRTAVRGPESGDTIDSRRAYACYRTSLPPTCVGHSSYTDRNSTACSQLYSLKAVVGPKPGASSSQTMAVDHGCAYIYAHPYTAVCASMIKTLTQNNRGPRVKRVDPWTVRTKKMVVRELVFPDC
jgi:hypothetical protein